jgi:hypothetical protein
VSWIVPVLGLSLVAAVIAYVAGIGAARRLGAKLASFIGMTEVLFAILFAWLALGQLPTPIQFTGGAFILAGIALVRAGERAPVPATTDDAAVEPAAVGRPLLWSRTSTPDSWEQQWARPPTAARPAVSARRTRSGTDAWNGSGTRPARDG